MPIHLFHVRLGHLGAGGVFSALAEGAHHDDRRAREEIRRPVHEKSYFRMQNLRPEDEARSSDVQASHRGRAQNVSRQILRKDCRRKERPD